VPLNRAARNRARSLAQSKLRLRKRMTDGGYFMDQLCVDRSMTLLEWMR
jgi:hypothetical protein